MRTSLSSDTAAEARARRAARRRAVPGARHGGLDGGDRRALPHVPPDRQRGRDPESLLACLPTSARSPRGAHRRDPAGAHARRLPLRRGCLCRRPLRRDAAHRRLQPEQPDRERDGDGRHPPPRGHGNPAAPRRGLRRLRSGAGPDAVRAGVRQRDRDANVLEGVLPGRRQGRLRGRRRRLLDHVDRFLVPGSSISSPALHAGLAALEDEGYHDRQVARIAGTGAAPSPPARPRPAGVPVCGELHRGGLRGAPGRRGGARGGSARSRRRRATARHAGPDQHRARRRERRARRRAGTGARLRGRGRDPGRRPQP